ncbi:MAG: hypothetical protein KDK70_26040 [Myxococcales bacterium]|nr:hypothetical protein [Myxococcales bacterium]
MTARTARVLLGDSTPSELPSNVLDVITEVVLCARDVATPFAEIQDLERRRAESARVAEAVIKELEGFAMQTRVGVRATASAAVRPEVRAHGEEVVEAVGRMITGWQRQYERKRDTTAQQVSQRIAQLKRDMHAALERFLLPRRNDAPVQRFHRFFDGQRYLDTAVVEPLEGVRITLSLADPEPELPRRLRSLLGKGNKIQVGTRLSRIRRIEEPVIASLDDTLLLEAERGPGRLRVTLTKKMGTADVFRIEVARTEDGLLGGRVTRGEGEIIDSPLGDRPVLQELWNVLDAERQRILHSPAHLVEISLDGRRVEDAEATLAVAERLVRCYRGTVATLARHSPNPEELTIKIETADGKREEAWIRRGDLAQHLLGLPAELRGRMGMAELLEGADPADLKTSVHTAVGMAIVDEEHSLPIELVGDDPLPEGVPGSSPGEMTQDIALEDVMMEADDADSGCIELTRVRSR